MNEIEHSERVKQSQIAGSARNGWSYALQGHIFFIHQVGSSTTSPEYLVCVNAHLHDVVVNTAEYLERIAAFGKMFVTVLNLHNSWNCSAVCNSPALHELRNIFVVCPPTVKNLSLQRVANTLLRSMQEKCSDQTPQIQLGSQFKSVPITRRDLRSVTSQAVT